MEKVFEAKLEKLDDVMDFMLENINGTPAEKHALELRIVVEELFVNIAMYAYQHKNDIPESEQTVLFSVESEPSGLVKLRFEDGGYPFDPLSKQDPDMADYIKNRTIGGLGIMIVKKKMDHLEYEYKDNKNVLRMDKKFEAEV